MSRLARFRARIRRFVRRPFGQKSLVLEAYALLFVARMAVLALPFKRVLAWSGVQGVEMEAVEVDRRVLQQVYWAITTASRYGWWNCLCLTQALAAKAMLRRRGLRSTMYLGLTRPGSTKFSAHAWLRCGQTIITGAEGRRQFTVIAKFTELAGPAESSRVESVYADSP